MLDFETDKIDGRSMMTEDGHPIIFLNKFLPGERQRLTLAHELGHIMMHLRTYPTFGRDEEAEAFEFASEFLMPEAEIKYELTGKLTLEKLADLKRIWKMSMGSILYWAEKLNSITPNQSRYLWVQYSARGYKRQEPLPITIDTPTLISRMISVYGESQEYPSTSIAHEKIAETFSLSQEEFKNKFITSGTKLRVA
jgi:Zn-dependent peptidase ImmA (M78 family)